MVLVILAILAAVMVPALTGWINKAKEKQIMANARTVYLAAQTLASEHYADSTKKEANKTNIIEFLGDDFPAGGTIISINVDPDTGKVTDLVYQESGKKATLSSTGWSVS